MNAAADARPLSATVLICTYNRADLLARTLDSLRTIQSARPWDVLVVDNRSTDATRTVVQQLASGFPVPLRYTFEPEQGKSRALNTGLAHIDRDIVAFTDDDVQVERGWLDAACEPLEREPDIDYTGGPVQPWWHGTPPPWFDRDQPRLWGTLALLDYGPEPFIFEERRKVPLGVNMAVRRRLIARIGGFHPAFGRTGTSLLGQEQAEFFARAHAAGARGRYVPAMTLRHHVPAARLTKTYFRRWWLWKGISRSRLDRLHQRTETGLDLRAVPHLVRVPRYVWGALPRTAWAWARAAAAGDVRAAAASEMHLWYTVGYIHARVTQRAAPPAALPPPVVPLRGPSTST